MAAPELTIAATIPWDLLQENLQHKTVMRDDPSIHPYADAQITLEEISYDDCYRDDDDPEKLWKTASYYARGVGRKIGALTNALSVEGLHPLDMEGGLILESHDKLGQVGADGQPLRGKPKAVALIPPIIEVFGDKKYVLDGGHRAQGGFWDNARGQRDSLMGIVVRGVTQRPYAEVEDWNPKLYEVPPTDPAARKRYISNAGKFYRDYNDVAPIDSNPRYNLPS